MLSNFEFNEVLRCVFLLEKQTLVIFGDDAELDEIGLVLEIIRDALECIHG
jgi:hypothetical protein